MNRRVAPLLPLPRAERHGPLVKSLAVGLAASLLGLAFVVLASEVGEGETRSFDMHLLQLAQSLRDSRPWFVEAMRDLSSLGSTTVLTLFTVMSVVYLASVRARTTAMLVAAAVLTGTLAVGGLKTVFGRVRPGPAFADMVVPGLSFPSGHAAMSAIVFLTLGALVASTRNRVGERSVILVTAALLTLLVGLSRTVLGVHWATDVLGGWAFGSGWALVWLLIDRRLTDRAATRLH